MNPDPLTIVPDEPEPGHEWDPLRHGRRRDTALVIGAAAVIALILFAALGVMR